MTTPLLRTKLYIPPVRPELVSRPRLIERLNAGLHRKLTLVSAPAGFGKTTLLSEWIYGTSEATSPLPVAWLSLDEGDNDLVRFLMYLVAALQTVNSGIGKDMLSVLQSPQLPPLESLLTLLINDLAGNHKSCPYVLVLDDYHLIIAQPVHEALTFLLDHLPPTLHLVIATRADPPLPLPRLRARGQLTELRQADLRFTTGEAAAFLNQVMGLNLSDTDVAALEARTEGWIAGLQVAAVSMQGREDASAFIRAFTGSDRYILDYLVEEVLQRQPEDVQTFLLQTSILNRLSGPLCDAVTGSLPPAGKEQEERTAQVMLEYLERANLFIVPLDDCREWYRYHRLFADLLRTRQEQRFAAQDLATLHRRAATWYEEAGLLDDAVQHAIAAGDLTHVARIIEKHGRPMLLRGELRSLLRWIAPLPEEMMQTNARLCITHAWALLLTGQGSAVEPCLQQAERLPVVTSDENLRGEGAVIRAYLAAQRGDVARTIEQADLALAMLDAAHEGERAVAYFVLGGVHMLRGDVTAAGEAMAQASTIGQRGGNVHVAVPALNALAGIQAQQGRLHLAWATAQEAVRLASGPSGKPLPIAGGALSALAELTYEWNDVQNALAYARQSIELSRRWGNADSLGSGYLTLARVLQASGDLEGAREALQAAERASRDFALGAPFPMQLRSAQARLWLAQGDRVNLAHWAEEVPCEVPGPFHAGGMLTLAQARLALGQPDVALKVLAPLLEMARAHELTAVLIEGLALQALIHQAQGDVGRALVVLAESLALAEPEGYVRRFVDLGPVMAELLRRAAVQGITPGYVSKLLLAYGEEILPSPRPQPLIEPLSERELEVLCLVVAGLTNQEIAQELVIAVSTVKSHINHIFGKLGVKSRTQAVARARALSLL